MRLISWNVNGRVNGLDHHVDALRAQEPDIIALQEIRKNSAPIFRDKLCQIGLTYITDSFQLASDKSLLIGPRGYGELIACRWPIDALPPADFGAPWTERVLSVIISSPCGSIELHTTYIPCGVSHGWIKIETLEGIFGRLARPTTTLRILCGDFNTPMEEKASGQVITAGKEGTRWDLGERNILQGLARFDLLDVYRFRHGYGIQEFSWHHQRGIGRRFDHVFASRALLNRVECRYLHSLREERLSDHSPIEVDFTLE